MLCKNIKTTNIRLEQKKKQTNKNKEKLMFLSPVMLSALGHFHRNHRYQRVDLLLRDYPSKNEILTIITDEKCFRLTEAKPVHS